MDKEACLLDSDLLQIVYQILRLFDTHAAFWLTVVVIHYPLWAIPWGPLGIGARKLIFMMKINKTEWKKRDLRLKFKKLFNV